MDSSRLSREQDIGRLNDLNLSVILEEKKPRKNKKDKSRLIQTPANKKSDAMRKTDSISI